MIRSYCCRELLGAVCRSQLRHQHSRHRPDDVLAMYYSWCEILGLAKVVLQYVRQCLVVEYAARSQSDLPASAQCQGITRLGGVSVGVRVA
jgi:hypothetical protein